MATLIFDLDGVIWRGDKLVNLRIPSLMESLSKNNHQVYFLTNNSTRSQRGYQMKLARLGIKAHRDKIICSAHAARAYLESHIVGGHGKRRPGIFVIGEKSLKNEIGKLPVEMVKLDDDGKVDYVVVGVDRNFTYRKLARAMRAILDGAKFVATNADKTVPIKNRRMVPGCGSIIAAISTATNQKPYVVGKPNPFIIRDVLEKSCSVRRDMYIIGDRLDTDIVLANRLGLRSVLVLSGAATKEMARKSNGLSRPEYVIRDITKIEKVLNLKKKHEN